jgi:N-acetylglucosaminyldiphosphoundecaprenol N-acetyl-beta-D-mannosaminyltransferase
VTNVITDTRGDERPRQIEVMGLPLHTFTMEGVVQHLIDESSAGKGGYVVTPNLDNMFALTHDRDLRERAMAAEVRVADGMPLVWASRIKGEPLPGRVPGSDLILALADRIATAHQRLFLLGGEPGTADRAALTLRERTPGLEIAGTHCPPHGYERSAQEMERIQHALVDAEPDFVYLGLPFPKASALAASLRPALPRTWFLGLGISFSFVCGEVDRAPVWMQKGGLEWLHRLRQEPRRLARRYLVEGGPFALRLFWTSWQERRAATKIRSVSSRGPAPR